MYEASGTIKLINDTQTFASGFTKREFVVTTSNDRYPQDIKFEVVKDKCAMLDQFEIDQAVVVNFDIRGNEYNGKYFVNLACWKIQSADAAASGGGGARGRDEDGFDAAPAPRGKGPGGGRAQSSGGPPRASSGAAEPSLSDLRNENDFDDDIPF